MKVHWMTWWLLIIGMITGSALANLSATDALREDRPKDGIYDPQARISPAARNVLVREMRSIQESSGIDVMVVVLEKAGSWDPPVLAEEFAKRWGYHGGRAVVLWMEDQKDNPTIAVSGRIRSELSRASFDRIIATARERSRYDQEPGSALGKAVSSLGEDLRYAGARAQLREQNSAQPAPSLAGMLLLVLYNSREILIAGVAGLVLLGLACYGLLITRRRLQDSLVPKTFPEVAWKRRFGAPHAGIAYTHSRKRRFPSNEIR